MQFEYTKERATGIAQKTVPLSALRNMPVPIPPESEQSRILQKAEEIALICNNLRSQLIFKTDQTRLITYEREDNACLAVPVVDATEAEKDQAEKTTLLLGLNRLNRLNQKRAERWDFCLMEIANYKGAREVSSQPLRTIYQVLATRNLKEMVKYTADFSSISEACIRKNAPSPLIASVFEQLPPT